MSGITQTVKMPNTGPTPDEVIAAALSTAQDAMDVLGPSAEPLTRALALVGLGHPVWFAEQRDREYRPVVEPGRMVAPGVRTTREVARIRSAPHGNTVIFDIMLPNGRPYRCVYDRQFRRCGPFVEYVQVSRGTV